MTFDSAWTHCICNECYNKKYPEREDRATRVFNDIETCCFCGKVTIDGIYVRQNNTTLLCKEGHNASDTN